MNLLVIIMQLDKCIAIFSSMEHFVYRLLWSFYASLFRSSCEAHEFLETRSPCFDAGRRDRPMGKPAAIRFMRHLNRIEHNEQK